jgi:hypothetical protein
MGGVNCTAVEGCQLVQCKNASWAALLPGPVVFALRPLADQTEPALNYPQPSRPLNLIG